MTLRFSKTTTLFIRIEITADCHDSLWCWKAWNLEQIVVASDRGFDTEAAAIQEALRWCDEERWVPKALSS